MIRWEKIIEIRGVLGIEFDSDLRALGMQELDAVLQACRQTPPDLGRIADIFWDNEEEE